MCGKDSLLEFQINEIKSANEEVDDEDEDEFDSEDFDARSGCEHFSLLYNFLKIFSKN